jgi:hypothetical protein
MYAPFRLRRSGNKAREKQIYDKRNRKYNENFMTSSAYKQFLFFMYN